MSFDNLVNHIKIFSHALGENKILKVTFESRKKGQLIRRCVPLDIAPSKKATKQTSKFHFFDLDSTNPHTLSLDPTQIIKLELTEETFQPDTIITWQNQPSYRVVDGKFHWDLKL